MNRKEMPYTCPRCGKEVPSENNPYRPFCSLRCKQIDLLSWLKEEYRIPGEPVSTSTTSEEEKEEKK